MDKSALVVTAQPLASPGPPQEPWQILIVDDNPEVHSATRLALEDYHFEGRPLQLLNARSGSEARTLLSGRPGIALVLLDVVMETEHAGLDLVRYIREELHNRTVRIVLRTGQPGQAPPLEAVVHYEIDDYRLKTELTYERLIAVVTTSLRTYRLLRHLEQQSEELARSNRDLESFAFAASHDMQTPVRSLVSFSQILEQRYGSHLDTEAREVLGFIATGARALQALIVDLVKYARVGRDPPRLEPLGLNQVVQSAWSTLQPAVQERHARLDCGPLPAVEGNAVQLEQLFRNLLDNALKYQPGENPVVTIRARTADGRHEIRVSDRGIGIEPQYLEQIFEPFKRLHAQDRFPGTGLGLALCRKVAQLHRGELRAESEPGAGTSFILTLPGRPPVAAPGTSAGGLKSF